MKKQFVLLLLLVTSIVVAVFASLVTAGANGDPGNDHWERYRAPWPERPAAETPWARTRYERFDGCPVGSDGSPPCQYHSTAVPNYRWAIDLNNETDETEGGNSDCDDPLRATRSGSAEFYPPGYLGNSSYLGIEHYNGPGDYDETWYVHVDYPNDSVTCDPQCHPWDSVYAQGDFAARMGDLVTDACHLHFYVTDGADSWNPSIDPWLSGNSPSSGYDLQHLSDDNMTGHESNNTGPGYGRPYAGTCPPEVPGGLCVDRGPENRPLVNPIRQYVRDLAAFTVDAGSTRASIQGPCGANRPWVKGCYFDSSNYRYTQNFVVDSYGYQMPLSVTEGYPDGTAHSVKKAMWKAYGRLCGSTYYTYLRIGRPITEEWDLGMMQSEQDFEWGHMIADRSLGQDNVYVTVIDESNNSICTIGAYGGGGLRDWLDFSVEPCYDVSGEGKVSVADTTLVQKRGAGVVKEWDPINQVCPGFNYDDRYDLNRDGKNTVSDSTLVARQAADGVRCR